MKRAIAARVGYRCSNPECRTPTSGPQLDPSKSLNVGVAAHITTASPGGPRYDPSLRPEERRHANNAIWLCQTHGKLVDNDKLWFTKEELRRWKRDAESEARLRIGKTASAADPMQSDWSEEELILLSACAENGEIFVHDTDQTGKFIEAGRQHFYDESDPRLIVPNAAWEPFLFKIIDERTAESGLPRLRTVRLTDDDIELPLWVVFGQNGEDGLVLRRSAGQWSALHLLVVFYHRVKA